MTPQIDFTKDATAADLWNEEGRGLSPNLFLGTSTWNFPEWKGILYRNEYRSDKAFSQNSLAEYATCPWFKTVCIDSFFYNPPKPETLLKYAEQVPDSFRWVSKVWERITIHTYPRHQRYGAFAGQLNPYFLNAELFIERVLNSYAASEVKLRTGPLVFQFSPFSKCNLELPEFLEKLDLFLTKLPKDFQYAVEIRNSEFLVPEYFQILNKHSATHCFNHWNGMPGLRFQMQQAAGAGGLSAPFYVARLLTPLGISYENAEKALAPYTALKKQNPQMRADVVQLARRALGTGKQAFITANNKAEGNAPLTMVSIAQQIKQNCVD